MGSRYSQLSLPERHQIARWRDAKVPVLDMARRLSRHVSTVHRELRRNRTDAGAWLRGYFAIGAQQVSDLRRRRRTKLHAPSSIELRSYIVEQLGNGWSPEQIAGYLRRTRCLNDYVCHETIYRYVYSPKGRAAGLPMLLPTRRVRRRARYARRPRGVSIPLQNAYAARPVEVANRGNLGHWECDLIMFKRESGQHNVTTLVDRSSRFVFLIKNTSRHSTGVMEGVGTCLEPLPSPLRRTITFDRGTEFAFYSKLRSRLGMESYFCKPQAPWQKGTVENTNGRIRRYLPSDTNMANVSQADLDQLASKLNSMPRKCLSYQSPLEVFEASVRSQVS